MPWEPKPINRIVSQRVTASQCDPYVIPRRADFPAVKNQNAGTRPAFKKREFAIALLLFVIVIVDVDGDVLFFELLHGFAHLLLGLFDLFADFPLIDALRLS